MSFKNTLVGAGLIFLVLALTTCGGGKSGGSQDEGLGITGTGFGYTGLSGNLTGAGTSGQYPILDGVNIPIQIQFTEELDPDTVNTKSIDIRTIDVPESQDPDNLVQTSGGIQANVTFQVYGSTLVIFPVLSFSEGDPVFGFRKHAAYEVKFQSPPAANVVKSKSGKSISVPTGQPFVFITTGKVYDRFEGTPDPMFYYYDASRGPESSPASWILLTESTVQDIPVEPLPKFRVFFDEPVLKLWSESMFLVNSSDHTSNDMQVQFYPEAHKVIPVPGLWYIVQTTDIQPAKEGVSWRSDWLWNNPNNDPLKVGMSYVIFEPNASMQALPSGIDVELVAKGLVSDLAENVKGEDLKDIRRLRTTLGIATVDDIIEDFSDHAYEDDSASSGTWGEVHNGKTYLTWGGGGGTGVHGVFYPPKAILGWDSVEHASTKFDIPGLNVDFDNKIIEFPTCIYEEEGTPPDTYKVWSHFEYNFTSFHLPFGWTVKAADLEFGPNDVLPDRMDLTIFVSGQALIEGEINVDGGAGESRIVNFDDSGEVNVTGTKGGVSYTGGAPGGAGGSIPSEEADPRTIDLNKDPLLEEGTLYGDTFDVPVVGVDVAALFNGVTGVNEGVQSEYVDDPENPGSKMWISYIVETDADLYNKILEHKEDLLDQMIQSNVGVGIGGKNVVSNHPTFYIKEIEESEWGNPPVPAIKIHTYADEDKYPDKFKGRFDDESNDPDSESQGWGGDNLPLTKTGDTYIIGYLQGNDGESSSVIDCGGKGGEALTVAQGTGGSTFASAGGGGGGGAHAVGNEGETGPTGSGIPPLGGNSYPETVGGAQSADNLLTGSVELVINAENKIVVYFDPAKEELSKLSSDFDPADLAHYRLNPNTDIKTDKETNDWFFEIENAAWYNGAQDQIEFTVIPITRADRNPDFTYDLEHEEVGATFGATAMLVAPEYVGGSGGGGSGIELTNSDKVYDLQPEVPPVILSSLPYWRHGAGGGSGGGAISLESAKSIEITASGKITAHGGSGGELGGFLGNIPSGGGGSGGSIVLRARNAIQVQYGGTIAAQGGTAKVSNGPETAGIGGEGFIRLETSKNDLMPTNFSNERTVPQVVNPDLGKFVSNKEESLGISSFYAAGVIFIKNSQGQMNYRYTNLEVTYLLDVWDANTSEYVETEFSTSGPQPAYDTPPFEIALNSAEMIPETGFLDITSVTDDYIDYVDESTFDDVTLNKPYIRFKILLRDKEPGKVLYDPQNPALYMNPRIKEFKLSIKTME